MSPGSNTLGLLPFREGTGFTAGDRLPAAALVLQRTGMLVCARAHPTAPAQSDSGRARYRRARRSGGARDSHAAGAPATCPLQAATLGAGAAQCRQPGCQPPGGACAARGRGLTARCSRRSLAKVRQSAQHAADRSTRPAEHPRQQAGLPPLHAGLPATAWKQGVSPLHPRARASLTSRTTREQRDPPRHPPAAACPAATTRARSKAGARGGAASRRRMRW